MTVPLYIDVLCPDLLLGSFRKHVLLPLELLGPSHCECNSNLDNEMPEAWAHRPVQYTQG